MKELTMDEMMMVDGGEQQISKAYEANLARTAPAAAKFFGEVIKTIVTTIALSRLGVH